MQHLKLAVTPGNAIIRIAMGPEGTNFAFIELRSEEVRCGWGFIVVWGYILGREAFCPCPDISEVFFSAVFRVGGILDHLIYLVGTWGGSDIFCQNLN